MSSFEIEVSKYYEHLNFTEDDIRYILYNYYLKPQKKYNKYTIDTIYTVIEIINVYYAKNNYISSYLFTIKYEDERYKDVDRIVFKEHIPDYLLLKMREYKIKSILNEE